MDKICSKDLFENNPKKLDIFLEWGRVNNKIIDFENKCKSSTFKYLFGDEEGIRLWEHFVLKCDRRFEKLRTYLTIQQFNDLLVNIYYNENLYIY